MHSITPTQYENLARDLRTNPPTTSARLVRRPYIADGEAVTCRCALGQLLHAQGYSDKVIEERGWDLLEAGALHESYGLSGGNLREVWYPNDIEAREATPEERAEIVLASVRRRLVPGAA